MWSVLTGLVCLVTFLHWLVVLKQNYINRLPLSQAVVASQRNSFRSRRDSVQAQSNHMDELVQIFNVNLP